MPVEVNLLVSKIFVLDEKETLITAVTVYCPELDMIGIGRSREEAEANFRTNLKMNLAMAKAQGALKNVLTSFGWTAKDGRWSPPEIQMEKTTVTL